MTLYFTCREVEEVAMDQLVEMAYNKKMVSSFYSAIAHINLVLTISCDIFSYFLYIKIYMLRFLIKTNSCVL